MNRTTEFFNHLRVELQKTPYIARQQVYKTNSQFSITTRDIQSHLSHTSDSIDTLRNLIESDNVLGTNDQQIQELILALNSSFGMIMAKIDNVSKMNPQNQSHANNVAQSLRQNLQVLSEEYQRIITNRSQKIAEKNERRRQTIGTISSTPINYSTLYGSNDEVEIPIQQQETVEQQRERYDMVRDVERSVSEISQLFVQLADIISQHDYAIDRIDQNTQEAINNMDKGLNQLKDYYNKVKGNKKLMIKIFAILLVFAIVFILIV